MFLIMLKHRTIFFSLLIFAAAGCMEKAGPDVQVDFGSGGTTAFADANVADYVFIATNVPSNNKILDQDKDGSPDVFVYPRTCTASLAAQCGFKKSASGTVIDVGDLPLNFVYQIEVRFRDAAGNSLYTGLAQFTNDGATLTLSIPVSAVTS